MDVVTSIFGGIIGILLLILLIFLIVIFPIAAWRIYNDVPRILNRLNTIIEILNERD